MLFSDHSEENIEVVLDPNELSSDGTTSISQCEFSECGKYPFDCLSDHREKMKREERREKREDEERREKREERRERDKGNE